MQKYLRNLLFLVVIPELSAIINYVVKRNNSLSDW